MDPDLERLLLRLLEERLPAQAEIGLVGLAVELRDDLPTRSPPARVWLGPRVADLAAQGARNLDLLVVVGPGDPPAAFQRLRGGGALIWSPPPDPAAGQPDVQPWTDAGFEVQRFARGSGSPIALRARLRRALGRPDHPWALCLRRWSGTGEH